MLSDDIAAPKFEGRGNFGADVLPDDIAAPKLSEAVDDGGDEAGAGGHGVDEHELVIGVGAAAHRTEPVECGHTDGGPSRPQSTRPSADGFFDQVRSAGIRRSQDRWVAGVCGGLADKWGLPPTLVRIVWLLLSLLPGPMWVVYVVMWILLPEEPEKY